MENAAGATPAAAVQRLSCGDGGLKGGVETGDNFVWEGYGVGKGNEGHGGGAALCVLGGERGSSSTLSDEGVEQGRVSESEEGEQVLVREQEQEEDQESEACSLSLGGGTDDVAPYGRWLEGQLRGRFCGREGLRELANLEAVVSAKARRWQRRRSWLELGWGGGRDSDLGEAEVLDVAGQEEVHQEDEQEWSSSWKATDKAGVVASAEPLICTTARQADESSVLDDYSSSFGGGHGCGNENVAWFESPRSRSKAVTSRFRARLLDPATVDTDEDLHSCGFSMGHRRDGFRPDGEAKLLEVQKQPQTTTRKRARRKRGGESPPGVLNDEVQFKVVSRRKRQVRRPKATGYSSVKWGSGLNGELDSRAADRAAASEVLRGEQVFGRSWGGREKWCRMDGYSEEVKLTKRKAAVHQGSQARVVGYQDESIQGRFRRKQMPDSAANDVLPTEGSSCTLSERVLCDTLLGLQGRRVKTRTMIRALQRQRGGGSMLEKRLKYKRVAKKKSSGLCNFSNSYEGVLTCEPAGRPTVAVPPKLFGVTALSVAGSCKLGTPVTTQVECFHCKGSLSSGQVVTCNDKDCGRVYHYSCARSVEGFSWRRNEKLICPHHVCVACRKVRAARLWRCEKCPMAFHELCCPSLKNTNFSQSRPGWAICWLHSVNWKRENKHKQPTSDIKEIFRRLPIPDLVDDFKITSSFWKEVMENDKEPPPYTHIRRNVFLVKKKRDDFDEGATCSCHQEESQICGEDCECRVQSMSCSKSCKCTDNCTNKPFRKERRVKVVKTEHCGWGAEASENIRKGQFIIEYTGEVIDDAICEQRLWAMKGRSVHNFYMCEIAKDFIIDATFKGNPSRYLNHSCQPNCKLEKWRVDGETRVGVFALMDIAVGEPLTYNYKFIDYGMNVTCRCGAPNCRGAIGEKFGSNGTKAKGISEDMVAWGLKQKRSRLLNRLEEHIRFVVRKRKFNQSAMGS